MIETSEFLLYRKEQLCIRNGGFDFQAVSHNTLKLHQPFDIFVGHLRHPRGVEITKSLAISFTLLQDGNPT